MPTHRDPTEIETRYLHEFLEVANARVLEIGCGDGRLTWRYAASAGRVIAFDPYLESLQAAVNNVSPSMPVSFTQARAQALPFPRETFDGAILAWSL